ncbi:MAG: hypothetical protein RLZZ76_259 [Candidatus Parcubacteria bacterium]|jgi:soluble lytic murein transglycosylase-like protein
MRIEFVKRLGKTVGQVYNFGGLAVKATVTAGFLAIAIVSQGTLVPQGEVSPIEQFLLENGVEEKAAPKKSQKPQVRKIKKINLQVSSECQKYFKLVQKHFGAESTLRIAQMHKESSCNKDAVGGVGEIGLFQVKASTCTDMGVTGNLFNPETNIRCAAAYLRWLCKEQGHCEIVPQLVAYNAGAQGAKRVRNLGAHAYPRAILKILGLRA